LSGAPPTDMPGHANLSGHDAGRDCASHVSAAVDNQHFPACER
jgi:hypothetical protein